jgi:hypothetical protein
MGADGSAYVVYGFRVTRDQFFEKKGTEMLCSRGHTPESEGQKFCPSCGGPFTEKPKEVFSARFRKFAKSIAGYNNAEDCWADLRESGIYEFVDRDYCDLGIHDVGAVESSIRDPSGPLAVGFKLMRQTGEAQGSNPVCSVPHTELDCAIRGLPQVAADLGITNPEFELFLTFYWSV